MISRNILWKNNGEKSVDVYLNPCDYALVRYGIIQILSSVGTENNCWRFMETLGEILNLKIYNSKIEDVIY